MKPSELESRKLEIEALCRSFGVERLDIFGSAARGGFRGESSDFDFVVAFHPCSPGEHVDRYFGLLAGLEDLLGSRVDLVEESAISNPYFRAGVESSRRLLYAA